MFLERETLSFMVFGEQKKVYSSSQTFCMAQTTVDHFYGMGKYSSQRSLSQKPFLLSFSSRQMMTLLKLMLGDNVLKIQFLSFL